MHVHICILFLWTAPSRQKLWLFSSQDLHLIGCGWHRLGAPRRMNERHICGT